MSYLAKRQYLLSIMERYQKAKKSEKKYILNEFCSVCRYSRKYAIRILNRPLTTRSKKPGQKPRYSEESRNALQLLWNATGGICSKRLKAALPEWLKYYEEKQIPKLVQEELLRMSPATIDRTLKSSRKQLKGLCATRPAKYWYKSRIPIQPEESGIKVPGYLTGDTVAHGGESVSGEYVNTLTITDISSTWTVNRAMWTKQQEKVREAISDIEAKLPFAIHTFKSDSGSEFINGVLFEFLLTRPKPITFFRTRPYHKNDNCHVEQKNFTHVRTLFGYERIDKEEMVDLMNEIYETLWNPLQNFFLPTIRLKSKSRDGAKVKRSYDKIETPYQRLMESDVLTDEKKDELREIKENLNPLQLRMELEVKIKEFSERLKELNKIKIAA